MRLIDADELLTAFPVDNEPTLTKSCVRMTIQHMPTIEPEPKWIPCSERTPDNEDKVLCCTKTKKGFYNIVIGYHTERYGWACGMNSNVIAWMPLPEPYTGGES